MREIMSRLNEYMIINGLNDNQVTVQCKLSKGLIGQARTGKSDLGKETVKKILSTYVDINPLWLKLGIGDMLIRIIKDSSVVLQSLLEKSPIEELSRLLGHATTQELEGVLNGKRNFEPYEIDKLSKAFPNIRKEWIETGEGEMYEETDLAAPKTGIRYYRHVSALMGTDETEGCPSEDFEYLNIPDHVDCKYAINAEGDSMLPLFKNGDVIFVNDWNESYIEWGRVYLVVTSGGNRLIKRLFPSDKEGCVTCRSENTFYPDFEVELAHTRLFLVKGAMAIKPL